MNPFSFLLWVLGVILAAVFGTLIYLDMFESTLFFGIVILAMDYALVYLYLVLSMRAEQAENADKDKFNYCWQKANEMLLSMPGGDRLEWWTGVGRNSQIKTYQEGNMRRRFRSMYGYLTGKRQGVIIIWDIDNEDIAAYWSNPGTDKLSDPFKDFKPYENYALERQRMMAGMFGRKGRRKGLTIHYGDGMGGGLGGDQGASLEPDDDFVNRASKGGDGD